MPAAVGDMYQVTMQSSIQGQVIENVVHLRAVGATETDADIDIACKLFMHKLASLWVNTQICTGIIVKRLTPIAFDERLLVPTDANGSQTGSALNQTVALVLTKRTGIAGKSHRGRMYISAVPFNFTTDQCRLSVAGAASVGTFCTDIINTFGFSGTNGHMQFGVYSPTIGGSHPATLAGWQLITSLEPQIVFGNQRRRRVGVGI